LDEEPSYLYSDNKGIPMKKILIILLSCVALLNFSSVYAKGAVGNFTASEVQDVNKIIHNYLLSNPRILIEVSTALQKEAQAKQALDANTAIKANKDAIFFDKQSPSVGSGKVTVVEFYDYQCGHCKEMTKRIATLIKSNPNVRFVFRDFPIFGPTSDFAAQASLIAFKQGKFLRFHEALMGVEKRLSKKDILKTAKSAGLDVKALKKSIKQKQFQPQIMATRILAKQLKLQGTPAFIVANTDNLDGSIKFLPGAVPTQVLQAAIDQARG
jgi:protein-disulfide isomerase